jgi:hypothetical protein
MVERSPLAEDSSTTRHLQSSRSPLEPGRLGVYTALGATVAAVPFPWLPEALAKRVRGALVHDIAVRHGLSLTPEARALLAQTSGPDVPRGLVSQALRFFGMKIAVRWLARLGPVGMIWRADYAVRTYALGRLFDRYLERWRTETAVRVDVGEARRVRLAADSALLRAVTVQVAPEQEPTPVDDQRDPTTALIDAFIGMAAGVPDRLARRLDVAFDELLARSDG